MKRTMRISTGQGEYRVSWKRSGYTYAVPVVRKVIPYTLGLLSWKVWRGYPEPEYYAEVMLPGPMRRWFESAVGSYEEYVAAWQQEKCNG